MKINNTLFADFETTTCIQKKGESEEDYAIRKADFNAEVYSWAIGKHKGFNNVNIIDGIHIEDFVRSLRTLELDTTIYFHNGGNFDLHFLLDALERGGYKQLIVVDNVFTDPSKFKINEGDKYEGIILEFKDRALKDKEFSLIVNSQHKIMELKMGIPAKKRNNKHGTKIEKNKIITFWDTNLMFTSSLKQYGETLNDAYKCDIFTKMGLKDEHGNAYRKEYKYKNYEEFENDGNEKEYLHQDVKILAEFVMFMDKVLPINKWKMTAAGTTYDIWKYEFFGMDLIKAELKNGNLIKVYNKTKDFYNYRWAKTPHNVKYREGVLKWGVKHGKPKIIFKHREVINILFNEYFPTSWMSKNDVDPYLTNYDILHEAYNGGITFTNGLHAGKMMYNVAYIDINSSYPTQMMKSLMPYGSPFMGDDGDKNSLKLYEVSIIEAYNENGLPFIYDFINQKTSNGKHYPKKIKNKIRRMTDVEYKRFKKYYKGEWNAEIIMSFKCAKGDKFFGSFTNYFYELKSKINVSPAEKLYAKLMLNALYGKFGQKITRQSKLYIEGKWETTETITKPNFYLPFAVWITANARMYMVDAIGERYIFIVNGDTDSFTILLPKNIFNSNKKILNNYLMKHYAVEIHPKKLGAWDIEYMFTKMVARRPKQYMGTYLNKKGEEIKSFKFAGMYLTDNDGKNEIKNLSYKEFVLGKTGFKQLRPFRTPTGIMLDEFNKQINHIGNYEAHPDYWFQTKEEYNNYFKKNEKLFI